MSTNNYIDNTEMGKATLLSQYYAEEKINKEKYGDNFVLLMQKGMFYEIYRAHDSFQQFCSNDLNIHCARVNGTKIDGKKPPVTAENPYMAGFPLTSLERMSKVLIDKNYTVGIMKEFVEDDKITRKITGIISPSTYFDPFNPSETKHLLVIYAISPQEITLAYINLSTGTTIIYPESNYSQEYIRDLLTQINPKEIVIYGEGGTPPHPPLLNYSDAVIHNRGAIPKDIARISYQETFLNSIYKNMTVGSSSIENLYLSQYPLASTVLVLLLQFAIDHDNLIVTNIKLPTISDISQTLHLSENCITQLNILDLIKHVDYTTTSMGSRLLKERILNPSIITDILSQRYQACLSITDSASLINHLSNIKDLDKLNRRVNSQKISLMEFSDLYTSLISATKLKLETPLQGLIKLLETKLYLYTEEIQYNDIDLNNFIDEQNKLDEEVNNINRTYAKWCDLPLLKKGGIDDNLYFCTTKKRADSIKQRDPNIIMTTTKSEVRIQTTRLIEISNRLIELKSLIESLIKKLYLELCIEISTNYSATINNISQEIAELDIAVTSQQLIIKKKYTLPIISHDTNDLTITNLRHPLIETISQTKYVTNDVNLNEDQLGILLYGLNWSGKTSYIRAVGSSIILAQAGLPVPATSFYYQPFTQLITKIAMSDNYKKNQSTFTNEVKEMKKMIDYASPKTLILTDELCSGTEITSALALVAATICNINSKKTKFIFTTHMHDLMDIPEIKKLTNIKPYHMKVTVDKGSFIFDRILTPGRCIGKYGIEIANYLGLPTDFIYLSNTIRANLNGEHGFISTRTSRYNKNIFMTECKECGSTKKLQTHHLTFQCTFREDLSEGMNAASNLIVLCESCHQKVHKNELKLGEFKQTIKGVEYWGAE